MLIDLFQAIDRRDAVAFATFLAPDCRFCFGNADPLQGAAAIREHVAGFFAAIAALSHDIEDSWTVPGGLVCHGRVTYTRHDGSTLLVPFANIFKVGEHGIRDYQIFADTSALFR